jgi:hypothetical protein
VGEPGPRGLAGGKGQRGVIGETGEQGDKGVQGQQGKPGEDGVQGIPGPQGEQGAQGPAGRPGPTGLPGVQGPPGSAGPAVLHRPEPVDLARNVIRAATDLSVRTVIDPRAGYRYLVTLTSRLVKLQAGVVLRVVLTAAEESDTSSHRSNMRSIA